MPELKDRLRQDGSAFGCMVMEFLVPGMPAIIAAAGADFALFDMEHTGASLETMKAMVAGCRGIGLAPLVRVPRGEYHFIARALDVGAHGVMVPMVGSAAEAARISPPVRTIRRPDDAARRSAWRMTTTVRPNPPPPWRAPRTHAGDRADRDARRACTRSRRSPPRRASMWCGSGIST